MLLDRGHARGHRRLPRPAQAGLPGALILRFEPAPGESPCTRCGDCDRACPERLPVLALWDALRAERDGDEGEPAINAALDACTGCAACDAACPSRIPLAARLLAAQVRLRSRALLLARAPGARARYEARRRRHEREALEQAQREESARVALGSDDAVAAAIARATARRAGKPGDAG